MIAEVTAIPAAPATHPGLPIARNLAAGLCRIADLDFWWHLETGEQIVRTGSIPREDIFSYTARGREYIDHEWLFQISQYAIYRAFGPAGIAVAKSLVIALTLYNGSVLAEVFRAGLNAVPRGQSEAAYAIGMRKTQVMTIVLLPQAVKIMLPAIISQMVVALKDTSLGYYITAPGLTFIGKQLYGEFKNQFQTVIVIAAIYIVVNLILSWVATWIQRRFVGEKRLEVQQIQGTLESGASQGSAF